MTQTVSKTQWPDYSEYGLYLLPRNYQNQYGFTASDKPGRCLLLLDIKESITPQSAIKANLRRLLHSHSQKISLYLVLPKHKRRNIYIYPTQSEILQNLELAYVARSQVTTPGAAAKQFRDALGTLRYDTNNLLDFSQEIGRNPDGDTVFFSPYGRYVERYSTDDAGNEHVERIRASKLPLSSCLYVIDSKGKVDHEALDLCVNCYLEQTKRHPQSPEDAKNFAQLLFQQCPQDIKIDSSIDITTSIIDSVINESEPLSLMHWQLFNNMLLVNENVTLHRHVRASDHYQPFFFQTLRQCINRHRLSTPGHHPLYKPSVETPLAIILANLLTPCFDGTLTDVYSPAIGNGSLLAAFKHPLNFHVNEPDATNFDLLKRFTEWSAGQDSDDPKASYFITNKEVGAITPAKEYDLSLTLLPAGVSPITTLIPFLDPHGGRHLSVYTDMLDQTLMVETLNDRNPKGRSVFLGPIAHKQPIGKIGTKHVRLLQWLQAYYNDVSVVDLASNLFSQTSMPTNSRLYVVGAAKTRPTNPTLLNERISHLSDDFNIPVFTTYTQLMEFEQAIKLIDTAKRRPDIDAPSQDDSNDTVQTQEEKSLISLFYTLAPNPSSGDTSDSSDTDSSSSAPSTQKPKTRLAEGLYISTSGDVITSSQVNAADNNSDTPAKTDHAPSDTEETSKADTQDDSEQHKVVEKAPDLSFIDDIEGGEDEVSSDDAHDFPENPGHDELDYEMISGGVDNEPDFEQLDFEGSTEPGDNDGPINQTLGDPIITRRTPVDSITQYQTMGDEDENEGDENEGDEGDEHEGDEGDEHEDGHYPNEPEGLDEQRPPDEEESYEEEGNEPAVGSVEPQVSTDTPASSSQEKSQNEQQQALAFADTWFDGDRLNPVYYGPRYIDDPKKYLVKRDATNHNDLSYTPPIFSPENVVDADDDQILAHEVSKFQNKAARSYLDRIEPPTAQGRLMSLSIVESHLPALILIKDNKPSTLLLIPFYDFSDGATLLECLNDEFKDYCVHSIFSLKSYQHNTEIAHIYESIAQINTWLAPANETAFTLNTLYSHDSKEFSELYLIAKDYHESVQPFRNRKLRNDLQEIQPHGEARLYEYRARYWSRNPEFVADHKADIPFCLGFEPDDLDSGDLLDIAKRIVTISNQDVYHPAFSQDFNELAAHLVPTAVIPLINRITQKLSSPKELSFLVFMRLTVRINALFLSAAHRFFLYTCNADSYKEWLGKLYSQAQYNKSPIQTEQDQARQALDVDYAIHLLKSPVEMPDSEATKRFRIRYNSGSSHKQAHSSIQAAAQEHVQSFLMRMQAIWAKDATAYNINAWFTEYADTDANLVPAHIVDMVFMSTTNTLLGRPTYIYNNNPTSQVKQFLQLTSTVMKRLNIEMVSSATTSASNATMHASNDAGVPFFPSNQVRGKKGIDCVLQIFDKYNTHDLSNTPAKGPVVIHYITQSPPDHEGVAKRLCQQGQLLPLHQPKVHIDLCQLATNPNHAVISEVYDQYARGFSAMRQLGMLAYNIASSLKESLLDDWLHSCTHSQAFNWWLVNQDVFLRGQPSQDLKLKRQHYINQLQATNTLSKGDINALQAIEKKTPLFLPNIKTCNSDAWITSIYRHLTTALQSPQVVTECLDFIKNGLQPILQVEEDYDDLLHHVLVSEQGRTLPFSHMFELKSERHALQQHLQQNPADTGVRAQLFKIDKKLGEYLKRRQNEVLALVHQQKPFNRPLVIDSVSVFLHEIGQFYMQDTTGRQTLLTSDEFKVALENSSYHSAFRQLKSTLSQMIDNGSFAKLPLATLDVFAHQLKNHGHAINHPQTRLYALQTSDDGLWRLDYKPDVSASDIDMHIITRQQTPDIEALRHAVRQSRLILANLPSSHDIMASTKKTIERLSPILSSQANVTVWAGKPLSAIDAVRHEVLSDYLANTSDVSNEFLSDSAPVTAHQYLHSIVHLAPTSHVHIDYDTNYLLFLFAQYPHNSASLHLAELRDKLLTQQSIDASTQKQSHTLGPQAVFTRRMPAQKKRNLSLHALIKQADTCRPRGASAPALLLGDDDTLHDIYYKDHYKPIEIDDILNRVAKLTIEFKNDLNALIDNHPDKSRIYSTLSDHESNAEADYFIELDDDKKRAYVYKYLIKDMAYRGIKHRISSDLYDNASHLPASFNTHRTRIAHELIKTADRYSDIYALCQQIQALTGVSLYAEQLQAQLTAKNLIDQQVDAVCDLARDDDTTLDLHVITCQPKSHLETADLAKNLPAISTMFGRHFNDAPANASVFLGKNEWLITCGFKLPHYERVFDLNNLLCYVANVGSDSNKSPATNLTNARHLYTDYVNKKALLVAPTHDVYQGKLKLVFETLSAGYRLKKDSLASELIAHSLPITWKKLEVDMRLFGETKGVGYEQILLGENEYYAYCQSFPDIFESISFDDVSGKHHNAMMLTMQGKARHQDLQKLFEKVTALKPFIANNYLANCLSNKKDSLSVGCYSSVLASRIQLSVASIAGKYGISIEMDRPSTSAPLASIISRITNTAVAPHPLRYHLPEIDNILSVLFEDLGLGGFFVDSTDDVLVGVTRAYVGSIVSSYDSIQITNKPQKNTALQQVGKHVKSVMQSVQP